MVAHEKSDESRTRNENDEAGSTNIGNEEEGLVLGDGDACTGILTYLLDRLALAANDSPTVSVIDEHAQCDVTAYNILHCR